MAIGWWRWRTPLPQQSRTAVSIASVTADDSPHRNYGNDGGRGGRPNGERLPESGDRPVTSVSHIGTVRPRSLARAASTAGSPHKETGGVARSALFAHTERLMSGRSRPDRPWSGRPPMLVSLIRLVTCWRSAPSSAVLQDIWRCSVFPLGPLLAEILRRWKTISAAASSLTDASCRLPDIDAFFVSGVPVVIAVAGLFDERLQMFGQLLCQNSGRGCGSKRRDSSPRRPLRCRNLETASARHWLQPAASP